MQNTWQPKQLKESQEQQLKHPTDNFTYSSWVVTSWPQAVGKWIQWVGEKGKQARKSCEKALKRFISFNVCRHSSQKKKNDVMAKKINHRQIKGRRNLIKLMQASGVFSSPEKKTPPATTLVNSKENLVRWVLPNCPRDLKCLIGVAEMIGRTP